MTNLLLICGLTLTAAALAAAVLAWRRAVARASRLAALFQERRVEAPLTPNTAKFRVVFATENGARARDLFALLQPRDDDKVELWNFGDCRGRKP